MIKAESETIEPDLSGQRLDRYQLVRRLGMGGMGSVYEAEHAQLGKRVAVKLLHHELSRKEIARKRFLREARAASVIRHPHIVDISDFGVTPDGHVFFVMELLEGEDLQELLERKGRLGWPRTQRILTQVASALGSAHKQGVIHRDIKPSNCFLAVIPGEEGKDFVKVVDFGIAKLGGKLGKGAEQLTSTDELFGTVGYMAPELVSGVTDDPRSDVYALGVMMYRMLVGQIPFGDGNAYQILSQHINDPPPPPREKVPSIPEGVERLILKALAKKPADRFASMDEFGAAIARGDLETMDAPVVERTEVLSSKILLESGPSGSVDDDAAEGSGSRGVAEIPDATVVMSPPEAEAAPELETKAASEPESEAEVASEPEAGGASERESEPSAPQEVATGTPSPITGATVVSSRLALVDPEGQTSPPHQDPAAAIVSSPDGAIETIPPTAMEPASPRRARPWLVPSILGLVLGGGTLAVIATREGDDAAMARQAMEPREEPSPADASKEPPRTEPPAPSSVVEGARTNEPVEVVAGDDSTEDAEDLVEDAGAPNDTAAPPADVAPEPVEATSEPDDVVPESVEAPSTEPAPKPKPTAKPMTDRAVVKRLRSKILTKCKQDGSTTVEIEGVISPTGRVASPLVTPPTGPGACARTIVKAAKFDSSGGVRAMPRFSVEL